MGRRRLHHRLSGVRHRVLTDLSGRTTVRDRSSDSEGDAALFGAAGQREKVAFFCLILPHSDVWFVKAYHRETMETFLDCRSGRELNAD